MKMSMPKSDKSREWKPVFIFAEQGRYLQRSAHHNQQVRLRKILIHETKKSLGQRLCKCVHSRGGRDISTLQRIRQTIQRKNGREQSISQITHRDYVFARMHTAEKYNVWFHEALTRLLALHEFVFEPTVLVVANDGRRPIVGLGLGA